MAEATECSQIPSQLHVPVGVHLCHASRARFSQSTVPSASDRECQPPADNAENSHGSRFGSCVPGRRRTRSGATRAPARGMAPPPRRGRRRLGVLPAIAIVACLHAGASAAPPGAVPGLGGPGVGALQAAVAAAESSTSTWAPALVSADGEPSDSDSDWVVDWTRSWDPPPRVLQEDGEAAEEEAASPPDKPEAASRPSADEEGPPRGRQPPEEEPERPARQAPRPPARPKPPPARPAAEEEEEEERRPAQRPTKGPPTEEQVNTMRAWMVQVRAESLMPNASRIPYGAPASLVSMRLMPMTANPMPLDVMAMTTGPGKGRLAWIAPVDLREENDMESDAVLPANTAATLALLMPMIAAGAPREVQALMPRRGGSTLARLAPMRIMGPDRPDIYGMMPKSANATMLWITPLRRARVTIHGAFTQELVEDNVRHWVTTMTAEATTTTTTTRTETTNNREIEKFILQMNPTKTVTTTTTTTATRTSTTTTTPSTKEVVAAVLKGEDGLQLAALVFGLCAFCGGRRLTVALALMASLTAGLGVGYVVRDGQLRDPAGGLRREERFDFLSEAMRAPLTCGAVAAVAVLLATSLCGEVAVASLVAGVCMALAVAALRFMDTPLTTVSELGGHVLPTYTVMLTGSFAIALILSLLLGASCRKGLLRFGAAHLSTLLLTSAGGHAVRRAGAPGAPHSLLDDFAAVYTEARAPPPQPPGMRFLTIAPLVDSKLESSG